MRNDLLKKGMIFGIIILFTGAGIIPPIKAVNEINNNIEQSEKSTTDWWPMFHHDLTHSGYSTSDAPDTNNVLWRFYLGTYGTSSSPTITDGKVYIGSDDIAGTYRIYCLNANTGAPIWHYTSIAIVENSAAVANGKVYFDLDAYKMCCLNAETGVYIWDYTTGGMIFSSPVIDDGKIYFGSNDDKLYCLDADTGGFIWSYTAGHVVKSSPAIVNGKVYFGSYDHQVYCLDADTGGFIWSYTTGDNIFLSSPVVVNNKVYIGSEDNKVYCLNADTGSFIWSYLTGDTVWSSPAVANDRIYFGSNDNKVYCLDANTGGFIWSYTTGSVVHSSPAVADGKIYINSFDTQLYCLNAETGVRLWNYTIGYGANSCPAIADGKLYIGSGDYAYCFEYNNLPNPPSITGPTSIKPRIAYQWNFTSSDPENDDIYYYVDWGDGTNTGWSLAYNSGETMTQSKSYDAKGTYTIRAKARNSNGAESDWGTLPISVPYSYNIPFMQFWIQVFERFPNAFPIFRHLIGY